MYFLQASVIWMSYIIFILGGKCPPLYFVWGGFSPVMPFFIGEQMSGRAYGRTPFWTYYCMLKYSNFRINVQIIWIIMLAPQDKIWAASCQKQQNDCAPCEDSDQPGRMPSLIRVFAVRMKKATHWAQRRLWSDWADAQAHLSLCWVHIHFVGFVIRRLK